MPAGEVAADCLCGDCIRWLFECSRYSIRSTGLLFYGVADRVRMSDLVIRKCHFVLLFAFFFLIGWLLLFKVICKFVADDKHAAYPTVG